MNGSKKAPYKMVGNTIVCECGEIMALKRVSDFTAFENHLQSKDHKRKKGIKAVVSMNAEYEELASKAKTKTLQQILKTVDIVHEVYIPELDGKIQYKKLTADDLMGLPDEKDVFKINQNMIHAMMYKADPSVTIEQIRQLGFDLTEVIMRWIMEKTPFLHLKYLSVAEIQNLETRYSQSSQRVDTASQT